VRRTGESAYSFLVFAESGMDDTHVEEDFRGIGNVLELFQGLVELVVVVPPKGGDPRLDFLQYLG